MTTGPAAEFEWLTENSSAATMLVGMDFDFIIVRPLNVFLSLVRKITFSKNWHIIQYLTTVFERCSFGAKSALFDSAQELQTRHPALRQD